uniref:acetate--CoA ligase n=1 Tax=Globodera pallida TaxID=36090 RepID=A0A183BMH8_GLOPA
MPLLLLLLYNNDGIGTHFFSLKQSTNTLLCLPHHQQVQRFQSNLNCSARPGATDQRPRGRRKTCSNRRHRCWPGVSQPPAPLLAGAHVSGMPAYLEMYRRSVNDPDKFWRCVAEQLHFEQFSERGLEWNFDHRKGDVFVRFMAGARTNIAYNCLERNIRAGLGDRAAYRWEGNEPGDERITTYQQLLDQVRYMCYVYMTTRCSFDAHGNRDVYWSTADCGWITGHSYVVYGPLLNGLTSVLFEGVPSYPDSSRMWAIVEKYKVTKLYTAPTAVRALMAFPDELVTKHDRSSLQVIGTVGEPINPSAWKWLHTVVGESRCAIVDTYWQTETGGHVLTPLPGATPTKPGAATLPFFGVVPAILDAEGRPFPGNYFTGDGVRRDDDNYYWVTGRVDDLMNVSGHLLSTAEIESALVHHADVVEAAVVSVPHPIKGHCPYAFVTLSNGKTFDDVLVRQLKELVRHKIGWITGHSYVVYGPLLNGLTSVLFEGVPSYPDSSRMWAIVEKYKVTKLYTAPTAVRALMAFPDELVTKHDRSSLQVIGTVGEPINPSAWKWLHTVVGESRCAIVDTYWQTETGGHVLTPLPGATPTKPGAATLPFFGVVPAILDAEGRYLEGPAEGNLCFSRPWPGMARTAWADHERYVNTYFAADSTTMPPALCVTPADQSMKPTDQPTDHFLCPERVTDQ